MCSDTFQNLSNEKKERIIHAALTEFSERSFSEASITNIVKNANISRGSFYQYFGNKEKVYQYLVVYLYNKHREDLVNILKKNSGNLYTSMMEFYNQYIDEIVHSKYFAFL
jgi:Transcriptional regulator